jgi:mono/diheme cytochrome c family protein
MKRLQGFLLGAAAAVAVLLGALYAAASFGLIPSNADAEPPALERWFAHKALDAAVGRLAPAADNPLPVTDANLKAGLRLYAADCAVCHGASDAKPSAVARGLYQQAPQFARYGVEGDDDGVVFFLVKHGVRMTAMPSFSRTLTDEQIWQVVLFLKNMDSLPPGPQKAWEAVPSAASPGAGTRKHRGAP